MHERELFEGVARRRLGVDNDNIRALQLDGFRQCTRCRHYRQHFVAVFGQRLIKVGDGFIGIVDE